MGQLPTKEVRKAFKHVRDHYPTVSMVVFTRRLKWCYMDEDFKAFDFDDNIDVSILEEAMDSVKYLPYIYEVPQNVKL